MVDFRLCQSCGFRVVRAPDQDDMDKGHAQHERYYAVKHDPVFPEQSLCTDPSAE